MILGPDGKPLKKPITSEIATMAHEYGSWVHFMKVLPNPDPILARTGRGPEVYDEMKLDSHIRGCLYSRKSGVMSKNWDVLAASEDSKDEEIAEFVKQNLKDINFEQDIRQMLDAPFEGFRAMEVIWEERDSKWMIKQLKARPQRRFAFGTEGELRLLSISNAEGEPVPPRKFVLVQHEADDDDNPYGVRLASHCFWPWMFKKHGFKFWAIFTEKYGMPTAVGKYNPGASENDKRELLGALTAIVQDSAIAIPSNSEVDFKETSGDKAEVHRLFLVFCNQEISKAILGQTLTTEIGEAGAYSAASVHADVKQDIVEGDAKMLMAAINDQLVRWLVEYNFGPQELYPQFKIFYEEEDIKKDQAERDQVLINLGLPIGANYFYDRYNIPRPAEDEQIIAPAASQAAAGLPGAIEFSQSRNKKTRSLVIDFDDQEISARGSVLDKFYKEALVQGKKGYKQMADEIVSQINSWSDYDDAASLDVSSEAQDAIQEVLLNTVIVGYMLGEADAWKDYQGASAEEAEFSEMDDLWQIKVEPLPFEEAVERFKEIMPVELEYYRKLAEELRPKYFTISRIEGEKLVRQIKGYVDEALEKGTTFQEFKRKTNDLLKRSGLSEADPWHMETVFRTNIQTAYNAGNWERMQQPEFVDMFPYYRYSAILDSQTRATHRAMHGFVAGRDDPMWDEWWPPNGYRCRCGVIAINKYRAQREGISISPTSPDEGLPAPDSGFRINPGRALREVPDSMAY